VAASPIDGAGAQQSGTFPDVLGLWHGSYPVAYPRSNAHYPDQRVMSEMELEVYRQDANLIWAEIRWRVEGAEAWNVEECTGTFDLYTGTELALTENEPLPVDWATTGIYRGRYQDGKVYLTYHGIGGGISFSAALERQAQ
jgi:hypothetical protein